MQRIVRKRIRVSRIILLDLFAKFNKLTIIILNNVCIIYQYYQDTLYNSNIYRTSRFKLRAQLSPRLFVILKYILSRN